MIDEFQKLPPQAIPVIRFLAGREDAAAGEIAQETGLSERAFGKAIRALITRRFAEMPSPGVYRLSSRGREALAALVEPVAQPAPAEAPVPTPEPSPIASPGPDPRAEAAPASPERRVSVLVAQEWVRHLPAKLMVGFDAASDQTPPAPLHLTLRVKAQGCEIQPREHTLDLPPHRAAGPVQFRVTPFDGRSVRVRIEVLHGDTLLGGVFFEVPVAELPTPRSAQFHALGALVPLAAKS